MSNPRPSLHPVLCHGCGHVITEPWKAWTREGDPRLTHPNQRCWTQAATGTRDTHQ